MSRALRGSRLAVALLALAPALALPAAAEDFAGWSDREVNAALAGNRQASPTNPVSCPTQITGDVAGAIDCAVNEAMRARPLAPATVLAQSAGMAVGVQPIEQLKRAYLRCEEMAQGNLIGGDEIARCSVVYEETKRRAFGGSSARLREWYREAYPGAEARGYWRGDAGGV